MKKTHISFFAKIFIIFCMISAMFTGPARAADAPRACGDNLTWDCASDGTLTISGTGEMWSYGLKSIPWDRNLVRSVVIKEGVASIGDSAFHSCANLTSVELPDSLTSIGDNAFFASGLTSVELPGGITQIGGYAFANCTALTSFTAAGGTGTGIDEIIRCGDGVFSGCTALARVSLPEGLRELTGIHMFKNCNALVAVAFPRTLEKLAAAPFHDCIALTDFYFAGDTEPVIDRTLPAGYKDRLAGVQFHFNSGLCVLPVAPDVPAKAVDAIPTAASVLVDGVPTVFDAYNIGGNNYFKLRDLAYVLNGSAKQFDVSWDAAEKAISLFSGRAYTAVGGEMDKAGGQAQAAAPANARILLDGKETDFTAYHIGGNHYFKLRDIGRAFDFGVDWDSGSKTIAIDTGKEYTPE